VLHSAFESNRGIYRFRIESLGQQEQDYSKVCSDGIKLHLIENDPSETSRNRFLLKRPSQHAQRELRLESWRVFYSAMDQGSLVIVNLIGEKRGNKLIIEDEEFEL
jgi:hypothetical protein